MLGRQAQDNMVIFDLADEFTDLANRLFKEKHKGLGHVSTALRYAAARVSSYEASCLFQDLAAEGDRLQKWYTNQFNDMLDENMREHIDRLGQKLIIEMGGDNKY
ncbi:DUF3144 domain-containing protein [Azorhizophilus paspali]|uniref:DUF3144 domain-containing protein n=1 Tax=Azorhizophilus paspali TaxID=69963 RepID=UPI00362F9255